jgi:hypothetical protein
LGNPLVSITIGANVTVYETAFPGNFAKVYGSYGKAAGTYTRPNSDSEEWEKGKLAINNEQLIIRN